jgi:hypothetical protein
VQIVERFLNRGVMAIERLPARPAGSDAFDWERILIRKSALASELDADWFIHHDADEFRESPWRNLSLREAIRQVDALGYNAIDFAGLDFWPAHDRFTPGADVREAFTGYADLASYDRVQVRCWKKTDHAVDLASSGGHEAKFAGRNVFPLRFILRHYPIRGQAHGERKVFGERRNRFLDSERARGWHVQYDQAREGTSFLRDPATLIAYDADGVRVGLALRHRDSEALEAASARADRLQADLNDSRAALARTLSERDAKSAEIEVLATNFDARTRELASVRGELERTQHDAEAKSAYIRTQADALDRHAADIDGWRSSVESLQQRLDELERSVSWRWTAPARNLIRLLRGR